MIGQNASSKRSRSDVEEGPTWNRLYGNPSYWNGYIYAGASSLQLKRYQFKMDC